MSSYKESRKRGYDSEDVQVPMFDVGDIVRLKTGKSPQKVMEVNYVPSRNIIELRCVYLSSEAYHQRGVMHNNHEYRHPRDQHDYVLYDGGGPKYLPAKWLGGEELFVGEYEVAQDLYMVKASATEGTETATNRFGTKLTVNSQGKFVLEMKGEGGKVEAFDPDELEIVLPYTVQVVGFAQGTQGFHFQTEAGKFNKDDILIEAGSGLMYRVEQLDSKHRSPKQGKMTFIRIAGEKLTVGGEN